MSVVHVRAMRLDEVDLRIDYFHDSTDEHLRLLGVDRALLPAREAWRAQYEADERRPIEERDAYTLVWELDGRAVGFSSADKIVFGREAYLHLHVISLDDRRAGLGTEFVRRSAEVYLDVLRLDRLFSEPHAFNVAPNRTLQSAGFRYVLTHETTPGPLAFPQVTNRWVLERAAAAPG